MAPVFGGLQAMIWDQPMGPITWEMVEANPDREAWVYPNPLVITREMVEANPDRRPWVYADLVANTVTQGDGSSEPL